jgi:hypothetical protein
MPPLNKSQIVFKHINFYFAFGEVYFHKIKGREALSRSHDDLNTTDHNAGLTESFSPSVELHNVCTGFLNLFLNFFWLFIELCLVKITCNNLQIMWAYICCFWMGPWLKWWGPEFKPQQPPKENKNQLKPFAKEQKGKGIFTAILTLPQFFIKGK